MNDIQRNIETVKSIYAAFGRGDVPAILEVVSNDVEWELGGLDHGIPWLVPGKGRDAAVRFFQTLSGFDVNVFEVLSVMADGPYVVGLIHIELTWRATGKRLVERCEAHVWKFDEKGRVAAMRHCADTHHHWQVAQP